MALADSTTPFFMQWDRDEQYPGAMPAKHTNGARAVTELSIAPRDAGQLRRWTEDADAPLHLLADQAPGLLSIDVQTDAGVLTLRG